MTKQIQTKLLAVTGVLGTVLLLSGCGKSAVTNQSNPADDKSSIVSKVKDIIPAKSDEEQIKDTIGDYYSLLGEKKFGDAYNDVAKASNVTIKEFVDVSSQKGDFVTGLKDITYNYIQVNGDSADVSLATVWNLMNNPITTKDTYNFTASLKMAKEESKWKVVWDKPKQD